MAREYSGVVEDKSTGEQYSVNLLLEDLHRLGRKQVRLDPTAVAEKRRYAEGSRGPFIPWRSDPILRVALAIGGTAYAFYYKSCVLGGQTSEEAKAHRVPEFELLDKVTRFVVSVLPEIKQYGPLLLKRTKEDGKTENSKCLQKKIYNCAYYAEFENGTSDEETHAVMYARATLLVMLSKSKLRKFGITPANANNVKRGA